MNGPGNTPPLRSAWDGEKRPNLADIRSAAYDQPADGGALHKILICSPPRTASGHLARLMLAAGLGIPTEYFHTNMVDALSRRWGVPRRLTFAGFGQTRFLASYVEALLSRRSINGIFSAKIQFWQLRRFLFNAVGRSLFDGALVVLLTRPDIRTQVVSLAAARLTRNFGFPEQPPSEEFSERRMRQALLRSLDIVVRENAGWQSFLALSGINPIHLSTDRVVADHRGVIEEIAAARALTVNAPSLAAMAKIDGPYPGGEALKARLGELLDRLSPAAFEHRLQRAVRPLRRASPRLARRPACE